VSNPFEGGFGERGIPTTHACRASQKPTEVGGATPHAKWYQTIAITASSEVAGYPRRGEGRGDTLEASILKDSATKKGSKTVN